MKYAILCLWLCLGPGGATGGAESMRAGVAWSAGLAEALEQAKAEGKPVFVALNMDDEKANDFLAKRGYSDKAIVALSKATVNVIGSGFDHAPAGEACPRFGSLSCAEHKAAEGAIRKQLLKVEGGAPIVAPQHFFLAPSGKVILSVPYAISLPELQWCFAAALDHQGIESPVKISPKSRAPKRLVMDDVPDLTSAEAVVLLNRDEALELLDQLKRNTLKGGAKRKAIRSLLRTDEKETLDYISTLLRKGTGKRAKKDPRLEYVRMIGALSPESYWPLVTELISGGDDELRNQAIVTLEQLGAEDSLKAIRKVVAKERDPLLLKNLLRAMASAGPGDKKVRKDLIRRCLKERDELLRINAVVALGHLAPGDDVEQLLQELSGNEERDIRMAAACAMALTRQLTWEAHLKGMFKATKDPEEKRILSSVRLVFEEGDLLPLAAVLKGLAGDKLPRPRLFNTIP